jgi:hypothetical protein
MLAIAASMSLGVGFTVLTHAKTEESLPSKLLTINRRPGLTKPELARPKGHEKPHALFARRVCNIRATREHKLLRLLHIYTDDQMRYLTISQSGHDQFRFSPCSPRVRRMRFQKASRAFSPNSA